MIIDTLQNASKYYKMHSLFAIAFEHILHTDFNTIEPCKYEIDGDHLKAIVSCKKGMTVAESIAKFECHDKHIDIQLCIKGHEKFGWKPRVKCALPNGAYNEEKDVQFFNDPPDMFFELTDGQFAIFFPEDVHAPMIGEEEIKKLVIKIRL